MEKPKVLITRQLPSEILDSYRDRLVFDVWEDEHTPIPESMLKEKSRKVDGMLTMLTDPVDESLIRNSQNLKIVANLAVGYDNVDVRAANKHGVAVTNTPDVLTETTADLTFGLLLSSARRIVEAQKYIEEGKWEHWSPLLLAGKEVHHKTIGIFGMGRIGEAVARRAKGFGMKILYHNRSRKTEAEETLGASYVSFDELLNQSDFVLSMAPLTEDTYHIFNKAAFEKMKSDAIFINTSRGKTMDEKALFDAVKSGVIAGAGLDVFENEPIDPSHPLLGLDQVVCLPHIGSASIETRNRMMELCLDNIVRCFEGKKLLTPVQ
ncbi:D-glycerate dehydrogenase [Halobacillus yeomjeoni]|uniref:2-hydroxyacid dehydrogenase n=1 Tax=Halobacillus yeomjeoni TaxID=311194 RepID=UPI001CD25368|nr:D-glycerate dehydrogenase [Halobacillus yeomjeoni]MCA0984516.1 D-glycerate dehydrogenase [Halobacillus yeomjeoni]